MQLMPPSRITDDGPLTRRNSARGNALLLRSPSPAAVTNNRLYRAPQAAVRNITAGGDRVGDTLFGNLRAPPQQQQRPNIHHRDHHHVGLLSPRLPNNSNSKGEAPASVGATAGTRRRRKGEQVKGGQPQQQQRPSYQMEKQASDESLGCISITKEKGGGGGESSYSSISKFCLSPHNGMPAPPLWTDDVMLHLSPPPLFSSLSPTNKPSCVSSTATPPSTRRLPTTTKRSSLPLSSHHGAGPDSSHHNTAQHAYNIDHSEGQYLMDEDSFGTASGTHHHHIYSHINNNGSSDAHNTSSRNINISSSLRVKQQRQQKNRFCIQRAIRNSCWYAAAAVQPASHGHRSTKNTWRLFYTAFKVLVVAACAGFVYDSHHRVHTHKQQMQEYESERAHILEQMIWIDQAAKKVHKKYSSANAAAASSTMTTLTTSSLLHKDLAGKITTSTTATAAATMTTTNKQLQSLQSSLDKLQVRIQLNARDLLAQKFGDRPAQVSLQIKKRLSTNSDNSDNNQHLVVALSDDTPHATATFVQQIDGHYWDDLEFETITTTTMSGSSSSDASFIQAIQIVSKNRNSASPLLEFVEPSRKCHSVGSVALRQVPQGPFHHVLALRIYLTEQQPSAAAQSEQHRYGNDYDGDDEEQEQEVCIGKVLHGLDQVLLPEFLIRQEQERQQEIMEPLTTIAREPHAAAQKEQPLLLQQRHVLHDRQEEEEQQPPPPPGPPGPPGPLLLRQQDDEEYHGGPPEEAIPIDLLLEQNKPQLPSSPDMMTTTIQNDGEEPPDMNDGTEINMDQHNENMVHNDYPNTNTNQQQQRLRGSLLLDSNNNKAGDGATPPERDNVMRKVEETPEADADTHDWLQLLLPRRDESKSDNNAEGGNSRLY